MVTESINLKLSRNGKNPQIGCDLAGVADAFGAGPGPVAGTGYVVWEQPSGGAGGQGRPSFL